MIEQDGAEASSVTLTIDSRQISREAALRAVYWFSKHLHIEFPSSPVDDLTFRVVLRRKAPTSEMPVIPRIEELIADFKNSLIDSELRVRVQQETSAIRELILAKAFAEAGVLEDPPSGTFDDPVLSSRAGESNGLKILHKTPL